MRVSLAGSGIGRPRVCSRGGGMASGLFHGNWRLGTHHAIMPPMNDRETVKVLIVNDDGQYLAGTAFDWEFTDDRSKARVFDYDGDCVAERIELVRKAEGKVWIAVRLDPREIYEFCDRCGCRL